MGVQREKITVTGIPNFDNAKQHLKNDFPHKGYVMAATSDIRETFRWENRKKFIKETVEIAKGRQLLFKLHPNEKYDRAVREIRAQAPDALIFQKGDTNAMIANLPEKSPAGGPEGMGGMDEMGGMGGMGGMPGMGGMGGMGMGM